LFPLVASVRGRLFRCTDGTGKLFLQAHLNTAIILHNFVRFELVGRHLARSMDNRRLPSNEFDKATHVGGKQIRSSAADQNTSQEQTVSSKNLHQ
jgi:hypothetical protein